MGGKKKNQENSSKHENGSTSTPHPKQEKVEANINTSKKEEKK